MTPEKMRQVREDRLKLSRAKLGALLGYTATQLANIEHGRSPMPMWMTYALFCILVHGPEDPFRDIT